MMTILLNTDLAAEASGYMIATIGWIIVFAALIALVFIFMLTPKLFNFFIKLKMKRSDTLGKSGKIGIEADVNAAIAMALHLYFNEQHDRESNIITIKNAPKQYSPWSSKIYSVNNQPQR